MELCRVLILFDYLIVISVPLGYHDWDCPENGNFRSLDKQVCKSVFNFDGGLQNVVCAFAVEASSVGTNDHLLSLLFLDHFSDL